MVYRVKLNEEDKIALIKSAAPVLESLLDDLSFTKEEKKLMFTILESKILGKKISKDQIKSFFKSIVHKDCKSFLQIEQ